MGCSASAATGGVAPSLAKYFGALLIYTKDELERGDDFAMSLFFDPGKAQEMQFEAEDRGKAFLAKTGGLLEQSLHHYKNADGVLALGESKVFFSHLVDLSSGLIVAMARWNAKRTVASGVKAAAMLGDKLDTDDKKIIQEKADEELKELEAKVAKAVEAYRADKDNKDKAAFEILDVNRDGELNRTEFLAAFDSSSGTGFSHGGKNTDIMRALGLCLVDMMAGSGNLDMMAGGDVSMPANSGISPKEKAEIVLDLLGSELVQKTGGKPIGLYFSAHWCPPCRAFTPKLVELYENGLRDKMEIIFVSADRSQREFDEYFGGMPWLALPYSMRVEQDKLSELFDIEGIPSFVVVGADGMIITTDGCSKVMADPKGDSFLCHVQENNLLVEL